MKEQFELSQRIEDLIAVFVEEEEEPNWDAYYPFWEDKHLTARILLFLIGEPAVPSLIKALKSENFQQRKLSTLVLRDLEDSRAAIGLLELFQNETQPEKGFLGQIAYGLAAIGDKVVLPSLCEALFMTDEERKLSATQVLGNFHDQLAFEPLLITLKNHSSEVRGSAALSLGILGDRRAYLPILEVLKKDCSYNSIVALGELGEPEAYDLLVELLLTSTNYFTNSAAARALGILGDKRAFEPLVRTLKSANSTLKISVIDALGLLGGQEAFDFLLHNLKKKSDHMADFATALGITKNPLAFEPLIETMMDGSSELVPYTIDGLAELGDIRAFEYLDDVFNNYTNASIRFSAALSLGKIGDIRALGRLEYIAQTDIEPTDTQGYCDRVCEAAVEAIKLIRRKHHNIH